MSDLLTELRRHQRDYPSLIHSPLCGEAADRIEALEAALESLTKDPPSTLAEPDEDWEVIMKMRAIACAALDKDAEKLT